jgi:hypothetical protein
VTLATDEVRSSVIQWTCGKYSIHFGWSHMDESGWREFVSGRHNLCQEWGLEAITYLDKDMTMAKIHGRGLEPRDQ